MIIVFTKTYDDVHLCRMKLSMLDLLEMIPQHVSKYTAYLNAVTKNLLSGLLVNVAQLYCVTV